MMPRCCVSSFVAKGIREDFRPAAPGDVHTCATCARVYRCDPPWREIAAPVEPLRIEDEDAAFEADVLAVGDEPDTSDFYRVAREVCHALGIAWTDPRTRITHYPDYPALMLFDLPDGPLRRSVIDAANELGLTITVLGLTEFSVRVTSPEHAYRLGQLHHGQLQRIIKPH